MFNRREQPGWMAIVPRKLRMDFAHVVRGGERPVLKLLESAPRNGSEAHSLAQARRSLSLQRYRCTTWVEPGGYQVAQVASPKVEPAELRAALRWAVKDSLDFPVEQALVDVLPIPTDGMPPGRDALALVVAAKRQALSDRVQAFQAANLKLAAIDVLEAAQRNIATLFETPGRGIALLGFHENGALLTFSRGGELYGLRNIDINLAALADAEQRETVFERVSLELQRSLDGFDRQFSQVPLSRLLIAGHAASQSFSNFLKDNLYLPVDVADLTTVLEVGPRAEALQDLSQQHAWYVPIGMALREESTAATPRQNINFYDASLRSKRDWLTAPNAALAVGACGLAVGLGTVWARHDLSKLQGPAAETAAALEAAQTELTDLNQRSTELQPNARLQAQVQLAQASVTQRQAALELLRAGGLGNETGHANALGAFSRQSLNGLWLTGVVLDHQQVALRGRSLNPELIPAYVSRLNKEAALQGRSFRALNIERPLLPAPAASGADTTPPPPRSAPYVEFSLASAQGAEAPAKTTPEAKP
jgi:MSHA biogenesis protein MshI